MKAIKTITIALLISISSAAFAQQTEVKENKNTYIQNNDSQGFYVVHNKKNIFTKSTQGYLYFEHTPPISVEHKPVLDKLV